MMAENSSGIWEQVSRLRPSLRRDILVQPHVFRHEKWFVLQDTTSGRFLRFNQSAYDVIGRFNGDLSIGEIVESVNEHRIGESVLDSDDVLVILAQLQDFEALKGGIPVNTDAALKRYQTLKRSGFIKQWANPIALRLPLIDPDSVLTRLLAPARRVFSRSGLILWLTLLLTAVLLVALNVGQLSVELAEKAGSTQSLLTLLLIYPVIKLLHEIGHGLAVKTWGGEVHEAGVLFLLFFPVPYVDASAAWSFQDKRKRIVVSAAGIMVELFLAAIGIIIWCLTEPGIIHSLALDIAIVGGVSTLLYNGNPLLRFDGYFVLEDVLEIPNLSTRSTRFYTYLAQRYLLGISDAKSPVTAKGEKPWFIAYGLISPLYRLTVLLGIAIYLTGNYLIVGVALALFAIIKQVVQPIYNAIRFLVSHNHEGYSRRRGLTTVLVCVFLALVVLSLETPRVTRSQGIVSIAESGQINAAIGGEVAQVIRSTGGTVAAGDVVLRLENRDMESRLIALRAKLDELRTIESMESQVSRVKGNIARANVTAIEAELIERERQYAALAVKSPVSGTLILHDPHTAVGQFIEAGKVVAYVVQPDLPVVRAVVDQNSAGGFDAGVTAAEVVLASSLGVVVDAAYVRAVPAAGSRLPSPAMGVPGGGPIPVSASDPTGMNARHQVFQYDLTLPEGTISAGLGERAFVRLTHGSERLWRQLFRRCQQLFLSQLSL